MRQENMIPNREDQPNLFKLAERISRRLSCHRGPLFRIKKTGRNPGLSYV